VRSLESVRSWHSLGARLGPSTFSSFHVLLDLLNEDIIVELVMTVFFCREEIEKHVSREAVTINGELCSRGENIFFLQNIFVKYFLIKPIKKERRTWNSLFLIAKNLSNGPPKIFGENIFSFLFYIHALASVLSRVTR
jgi:hypothetical protein